MKKHLFIIVALLVLAFGASKVDAQALRVFISAQVGTNPINGYVLTTDGTNSSWQPAAGGGSSKWEQVGVFLQPLVAYVTNGIKASYFTATSTTATSTFPNASTTNLKVGSVYDNSNSRGTTGQVLQSNGTVASWVATSSLGISGGSGTSNVSASSTYRATYNYKPRLSPQIVISNMNTGWSAFYATGSIAVDTSIYMQGTSSYRMTAGSGGGNTGIRNNIADFDATSQNFTYWVRSDNWSNLATAQLLLSTNGVYTDFYSVDLKSFLVAPPNNEWIEIIVPRSNFTANGSPNWATVNDALFRITGTSGNTPSLWVDDFSYFQSATKGMVTISFDDGDITAYTVAKPLLDKYKFVGIQYVIWDAVGTGGSFMSQAQVDEFHRSGWDIGGHGGINLTTLTTAQVETDVSSMRNFLLEHGYRGADNYALPNGAYNSSTIPIVSKYFSTQRTIDSFTNSQNYVTPRRISAFSVSQFTSTSTVFNKIDQASTNGDYLIITFHKIITTPTIDTEWSIAKFSDTMDYLNRTGIPVVSMSEAMQTDYENLRYQGGKIGIGIGTSTPSTTLQVMGTTTTTGLSIGSLSGFLKAVSGNVTTSLIDLASNITGVLGFTNGGTGQSAYVTGDMLTASTTNTLARLGIGAIGSVLSVSGGLPTWVATSSLGISGGTGLSDPLTTNGDIIARISGVTTRLPQGADSTFLGVSGGVLGYYTPSGSTNYLTNSGVNTYLNTGTNLQAPTFQATSTINTSLFAGNFSVAGSSTFGTTTTAVENNIPSFATFENTSSTADGYATFRNSVPGKSMSLRIRANSQYIHTDMISSAAAWLLGTFGTSDFQIYDDTTTHAGIFTVAQGAPASTLVIKNTGFVGIGSSTPVTALGVVGTTTTQGLRIYGLPGTRALFLDAAGNATSTAASASLLSALSDETGTGVAVFGTSPTFTTQIAVPLHVGGTAVGSTLTLKSTSGAGTSDAIIFQVGSNGGKEAERKLTTGQSAFGTTTPPATSLVTIASTSINALYVRGTTTFDGGIGAPALPSSTAGNAVCVITGGTVVNAGNTTCTTSSRKTKHDITTLSTDMALSELLRLRPVSYVNNEGQDARYGLIAEETNDIDPTLVELAKQDITLPGATGVIKAGEPITVDYQRSVVGLIVASIQAQQKQIDGITGKAKQSAQDNWQNIGLLMLFLMIVAQQWQIYKLKR